MKNHFRYVNLYCIIKQFQCDCIRRRACKTETTGETGLVTQATSETTTNSTEDTSSVTEENTSERDSSTSSTKEESLDSSTNSTTEEHSSVSETNTTDSKTEASQSSEVEKRPLTKMKRIIKKQHVKERTIKRNICYEKRPFFQGSASNSCERLCE